MFSLTVSIIRTKIINLIFKRMNKFSFKIFCGTSGFMRNKSCSGTAVHELIFFQIAPSPGGKPSRQKVKNTQFIF